MDTYKIVIRECVRTTSKRAKNPYKCVSRFEMETTDPHTVAERARDTMHVAGIGMRFSGMEEFGSAHEFWADGEHTCPDDGSLSPECDSLELDACRDWVENATQQLRKGNSEELLLSLPNGFTDFVVTCK